MAGDIWVAYFSKLKMACNELSSDNNFYIKRWNLIALFHFKNRQVFLPHPVLQTPHITHLHTTKPTRTHSHTLQNKYGDKVTPLGRMKTCSLSVEETSLCTLKSAGWFQSTPSFLLNKNRGLSPQYYGGRNMTLTTHFHLVHGNKMSAALPALSYTLLRSTQERLCVSVIQLT